MKHIKNTWKLFTIDWQRIFKNPIAIFLIFALMFIPSLYAWFNIKALWDPYGNTSQLPIAVYSDDKPAKFQDKTVNIGNDVLKNLKKNKQLGWRFVDSKADLDKGVRSGKYYAGIYLPGDFSKDLLSFTTGNIQKPKIVYSSNEKINAIAPKITSKGASSLQSQISEEFTKTASSTLLNAFNTIGYDIDKNMISIQKVKGAILAANDNLGTIDQYTQQVVDLHGKLPDLKAKLDKANGFLTYLPQADNLGQKIVNLNGKMPEIKNQFSVITTLQAKIPEIQNAGNQLAMIDQDFDGVQKTMADGIQEAKQGLAIINQVQTQLPKIKELGENANQFADMSLDGAKKLRDALPSITSSVTVTLQSLKTLADSTTSYVETVKQAIADGKLTPEEKAQIDRLTKTCQENIAAQQTAIGNLVDFMKSLETNAGNHELDPMINQLTNLSAILGDISKKVGQVNDFVQADDISKVDALLTDISSLAQNVSTLVGQINADQISQTVGKLLDQFIITTENAKKLLTEAQKIDFDKLLNATSATVTNAISILEKYQKEMPAIKQEIHDANTMLNGNMGAIVAGINKGTDLYQNELPIVEQKLAEAASFVQNDYPAIRKDLTQTLGMVNDKMPDLEKALDQANDLIVNDWPNIRVGIQKAADAIRKGEQEVDLGEVVKLLKLDATKESAFLTQPVDIQENAIYPIANNGSASTPFYTALCLWVGAVLFSSLAVTEVHLKEKDKGKYTKREQFSARLLTFVTVGIGQALIVSVGNYFALGVDVHNPFFSILFAVLIGIVFMIMVYVLVGLFGNIGKGLAIIILVLSISGGGGNYPIQVSGKFFQAINPYLPFTHAVNLLRESAGGIYWANAWFDIAILVAISAVFAILGIWLFPHLEEKSKKVSELAQRSHMFH
ncbi:YhgE/Pip domain-containing protein [Lactococcus piscium]|uniref:YhgE/Pip domain-containing protein n=1 Tax=Pseudolactococcus paracarnosus TaxID=2749962 RepID=A0ABT0ALW8_9LACT|nr:YhgE/Pip domain-containing protein [Lactococcus paracarnosus]MCJ1977497.1 YhgE/Pip domain-containing protein [Lactococcus paracarnosus]MCJ1983640.1 YhgE/Pip domain-containing protein [Lactococcus paracarnosus]